MWVNDATVSVTGHVWEHEPELRRTLFEVNALRTINGSLAALERMRPRGARAPDQRAATPTRRGADAATKHAAIAFRARPLADLRREGEHGEVSAVCPDGIWTPNLRRQARQPGRRPVSFSGVLLRPEDRSAGGHQPLDHRVWC